MAKDFKASQVRTTQIIASGSEAGKPALMIVSASSPGVNFDGGGINNSTTLAGVGKDVFVFVSGSKSSKNSATVQGVTVFGGDIVVSGTAYDGAGNAFGATAPGGNDTYVQFNDGGNFGGDAGLTYNKSTKTLRSNKFEVGGIGAYVSSSIGTDLRISASSVQITGTLSQGNNAQASGISSHAEGSTTAATGDYSHAEGANSAASGYGSHAEGSTTSASSFYSHAEGQFTEASGNYSHAEGQGSESQAEGSHAEGYYTVASGNFSHSEGELTVADGDYSRAEGTHTLATGDYSHAEGYYTTGSANYSHSEGDKSIASGLGSHAEGEQTTASGVSSHSEGRTTTASGRSSHAEGRNTQASADYSHAEGNSTVSSGDYSHAEGSMTTASGNQSHAEGSDTTASGNSSHAEGVATYAIGDYSHAGGVYTVASGTGQTVIGKYNRKNNATSLFVIGNGTFDSDATRSDIFLVDPSTIRIGSGSNLGSDTFLFVSGAIGSRNSSTVRGTAVFGGDVFISGTAYDSSGNAIGSTSPGGSDTQVQFNDGGSTFGGNSGLTYNKTTQTLSVANLIVTGASVVLTSTNVTISDQVVLLASGTKVSNTNGGIAIASGSITSNQALVFGRVANDTWGAGKKDVQDGTTTDLTSMTLVPMRASKFEAGGTGAYVSSSDGADLRISATSIHLTGTIYTANSLYVSNSLYVGNSSITEDGDNDLTISTGRLILNASETDDEAFYVITNGAAGMKLIAGNGGIELNTGQFGQFAVTSSQATFGYPAPPPAGNDTSFFVSGSIGSKGTSDRGTAVFGGDVTISGTLHGGSPLKVGTDIGLSGSLRLQTQGSAPDVGGNEAVLYVLNDVGTKKLYWKNSDGIQQQVGSGGSVTGTFNDVSGKLSTTGTFAASGDLGFNYFADNVGVDTYFFVSGAMGSSGTSTRGTAVFGGDIVISGNFSQGYQTQSTGDYSHAEGNGSEARNFASHAEGEGSIADGYASHAEGQNSVAGGSASHAEGTNSIASGDYSHTEGNETWASGSASHAEGESTIAIGYASHAEGFHTVASGSYSHAAGEYTIASGTAQTVVGKYNKRGNNTSLFIVGNGTGDEDANRKDIFLVDTNTVRIGSGSNLGTDTFLFISGSTGSKGTSTAGTAVFGGDVVISGTLHGGSPLKVGADIGLSGSLRLQTQGSAPDVGSNESVIYVLDDGGTKKLYWKNSDGVQQQVGTGGSTTVTGTFNDVAGKLSTTGTFAAAGGLGFNYFANDVGADSYFFVSGTRGSRGTSTRGTAVFGGDVVTSGALYISNSLYVGNSSITEDGDNDLTISAGRILLTPNEIDKQAFLLYTDGAAGLQISAGDGGLGLNSGLGIFTITSSQVVIGATLPDTNTTPPISGIDTSFFVSGALNSRNTSTRGTSVFGGDAYVSGTFASPSLSGSLTQLVDGTSYLIAGTNVTITTGSNGSVTIASTAGGGTPAGNNTEIQFNDSGSFGSSTSFTFEKGTSTLTLPMNLETPSSTNWKISANNPNSLNLVQGLNNDRILWLDTQSAYAKVYLTSSVELSWGDAADLVIRHDGEKGKIRNYVGPMILQGDNEVHLTGTVRSLNPIISNGGLSGSLTHLVDGTSYLIAGANVTITTGTNGSVTIASTGGGGGTPGGSNTQIQFNDTGSFAGSSGLSYEKSNFTLLISGNIDTTQSASNWNLRTGEINSLNFINGTGGEKFLWLNTSYTPPRMFLTSSAAMSWGELEDMRIRHNGTFGQIKNTTGNLEIDSNANILLTGTVRSKNAFFADGGLTGSLTALTDGSPYLIGGRGIYVSTGSNDAVTVETKYTNKLITGSYNVLSTDNYLVVNLESFGSSEASITLPDRVSNIGKEFIFRRVDQNFSVQCYVSMSGGDTYNSGSTFPSSLGANSKFRFISDVFDWLQIFF